MPDPLLIGITGLRASQIGINTAGHNIANVNTDSYSRQRVEFGTQIPELSGSNWQGTGVKTLEVKRIYDEYLTRQLRNTQASTSELDTYYTQASRIDNLVADPTVGLDSAMQHFFNALHGLGNDPSSIPARQLLINESNNVVDRFGYLQTQFTDAQTRVNQGLENDVNEVNALAKNIAGLNTQIVATQAQGSSQNSGDLLDELIKRLPPVASDENAADVRVAVVGRPNVGKSSFINRLLGENRLVVSDVAGTTRDAIDTPFLYHGRQMIFVDTAGLRRQSKVDDGV
ncbi:MAG: GTPase, partial [Pseudomonadota bacterium]